MSVKFTTPAGKYLVTEHGNGWAYEINTNPPSEHSLWFQDSDAANVQYESKGFEDEAFITMYFECLFG